VIHAGDEAPFLVREMGGEGLVFHMERWYTLDMEDQRNDE